MTVKKDICVVCAWRADCQKKFSISGKDIRCPDFIRDVSLPEEKESEEVDLKNKEKDFKATS